MSPELLPYELVQASRAVDVWAVGVLLFSFVAGQSLVTVDKNDDITEGQYMRYIAEWTEADCTAKLASCECGRTCTSPFAQRRTKNGHASLT